MIDQSKLDLIARFFPTTAAILRQVPGVKVTDEKRNRGSEAARRRQSVESAKVIRELRARRKSEGKCKYCEEPHCTDSQLFCAKHLEQHRKHERDWARRHSSTRRAK